MCECSVKYMKMVSMREVTRNIELLQGHFKISEAAYFDNCALKAHGDTEALYEFHCRHITYPLFSTLHPSTRQH